MYAVIVAVPAVPSDQIVIVSEDAVIVSDFTFVGAVTEEIAPGPVMATVIVPATASPSTVLVSEAFFKIPNAYPTAV